MTKVAESPGAGGQEVGMGLFLTTIFIAGQMAGGGVLMLPGDHTHITRCPSDHPDPSRHDQHRTHRTGSSPLLHHQWRIRWHKAGPVLAHGGGEVPRVQD